MPNDPKLDLWRQQYVLEYQIKDKEARRLLEAELQTDQEAILSFLNGSQIDVVVRKILYDLKIRFISTKLASGQIPLDGQTTTDYSPAFVIDHHGQEASLHRHKVPGLSYIFHHELDEVILIVTICKGQQGGIFPLYTLSHRDGRTHLVDSNTSMVNPNNDRLNR